MALYLDRKKTNKYQFRIERLVQIDNNPNDLTQDIRMSKQTVSTDIIFEGVYEIKERLVIELLKAMLTVLEEKNANK